jgi:hypothetical protein
LGGILIPSRRIKITPTFLGALKFVAVLFVTIFVVMTIVMLLTGQPILNPLEIETPEALREVAAVVAVAMILFAAFFFGLGRAVTVTVTTESIAGRTRSLRKVLVPVDSVTDVRYENIQGASALYIRSRATSLSIYLLLIGVNRRDVADQLHELIGPLHPLTMWFVENS